MTQRTGQQTRHARIETYQKLDGIPPSRCIHTRRKGSCATTTALSRGAIVVGGSAVPAVALPAVTATAPTPDPIFAAVAEHRWLHQKQYELRLDIEDGWLDHEHERFSSPVNEAAWALTTIKPTTAAGAGALFLYVGGDVCLKDGNWHPLAIANATSVAKVTGHPDADLFELGAKILRVARIAKCEKAMLVWNKHNPKPADVEAVKVWEALRAAAKLQCRYDETETEWSQAVDMLFGLAKEIANFVASTIDGVQIKRQIVSAYQADKTIDLDFESKIKKSIDRDITFRCAAVVIHPH